MQIAISPSDALIVVDMQKDFMPGGPLAVPGGDQIVPLINHLMTCFSTRVLTRDWHPLNHVSFSANPTFTEGSWPVHCVQETPGAEFHPDLHHTLADKVVSKADQPGLEAYSGFQGTDLADWLKKRLIHRVFICGVATDFCVKATALDAVHAGFQTLLLLDAVRAVNRLTGNTEAVAAMRARGVEPLFSKDLLC